MRRIRRKRAKYTWMPTLGGRASSGDSHFDTAFFRSGIDVQAPFEGPTDLFVTPIVPDTTQFQGNQGNNPQTGASLRDLTEGQDWSLRRIVGKFNVAAAQFDAAVGESPRCIVVGAAFFVMRADDDNEDVPDSNNTEIDPLALQNVRQPWIWRRTWILENALAVAGVGQNEVWQQNNTVNWPSALDGPHIDAKTFRRIRREERLWFVVNAYGTDDIGMMDRAAYATSGHIRFQLDYRILGAMRRSNNRSTF